MKKTAMAGFTLPEVMIASIILLIVSSGIMGGIIAALKTQANASDYYRATCIARNRIQHARTTSFDSFSLLSESNMMVDQDGNLCVTGDFMRTTMATNVATNSMEITVKVWYQIKPGQYSTQPVQVVTMIAREMDM